MSNKAIVIGAGRLGSRLAQILQKNGCSVIVIDNSLEAFNKLDEFTGFTMLGDASDLSVLESAEINLTKIVVIATQSDNLNLFLADVCFHIYDITNIYIRLNDSNKSKLIKNDAIKAICPFNLSVDCFNELYKEVI